MFRNRTRRLRVYRETRYPSGLDCHSGRGGNDSFPPCKEALLWDTPTP
nr:MAG TPA: hypothetical protein [Caudoviricetes sp.]